MRADSEVGDVVFGQNLDSRVTNVSYLVDNNNDGNHNNINNIINVNIRSYIFQAVLPNPVETSIPATVDKDGFVFGENLHERVTVRLHIIYVYIGVPLRFAGLGMFQTLALWERETQRLLVKIIVNNCF